MCGIAGVWGLQDEAAVRRMTDALARRGPDDAGLWSATDPAVTLGHRRLSILDLSSAGHQPMAYADGRLVITFNGEIYNYRELRQTLLQHGHTFRSDSDTEVILAAYAVWGPACVEKFRGMFALALVDHAPPPGGPRFMLARDRLGIKPLLYVRRPDACWFASEVRALREAGVLSRTLDHTTLTHYFAFGSAPQPRTFFAEARQLPPGHRMEFHEVSSEGRLVRYWDVHENTERLRNELQLRPENDLRDELRAHLEDATRHHLVSDVPVGAFLSGGVDSNTVAALMQQVGGRTIKTFSLGFSDSPVEDEREAARTAAIWLGSEHHEEVISAHDAPSFFDDGVRDLDQPSIDGFNTWLVARATRRQVKVAISGLGSDELFGGYPHFGQLLEMDARAPQGQPWMLEMLHHFRKIGPLGQRAHLRFMRAASPALRRALMRRVQQNYRIARAHRWSDAHGIYTQTRRAAAPVPVGADSIQHTSYHEAGFYLLNTLLRDTDVTSMCHGLEIRPIMLDHRLAEFAYALPAAMKWRKGQGKYLLREAVRDVLPPNVLNVAKRGFDLPYAHWMSSSLRPRVEHLLTTANARHLFRSCYLETTLRQVKMGRRLPHLWLTVVLLAWLEQQGLSVESGWATSTHA